ncbi:uncharacterized protein LOC6638457 isoform X2 [Drosophila willistoni]|uniref:uncharacterized protein LOC6638457 isoform X2 n=1 Tax=Drosophila willistoni TaxID=7260 RepID=UPI000C26DACA|nr:uncharacterized protein LOC6638457 isoform X2 [Drosophila willistoni]
MKPLSLFIYIFMYIVVLIALGGSPTGAEETMAFFGRTPQQLAVMTQEEASMWRQMRTLSLFLDRFVKCLLLGVVPCPRYKQKQFGPPKI